MLKRLCLAAVAGFVVSCTATIPPASPPPSEARTFPQPSIAPPPAGAPAAAEPPAAAWPIAGTYRIDSSHSELRLLVYRAGALGNLGHNHVMLNRSVNGMIEVGPELASSSFSLSAAVDAFIVDDAQARSEEGEDFAGDVSDGAKLSTWNNMTGPAVLDAVVYPVISVRSIRVEDLQGTATATVLVKVAGHEASEVLPFVLHKEPFGLSATASFDLSQTGLGMTPFSLMLGALAVRDSLHVKLKIIAQLETPRR